MCETTFKINENFLLPLAQNIKKYRLLNCYTQEQLSQMLFVTKQSISKWELGKSLPTLENIIYMCNFLKCEPNELIKESVDCLCQKHHMESTNNIHKQSILNNYTQRNIVECHSSTNSITTNNMNNINVDNIEQNVSYCQSQSIGISNSISMGMNSVDTSSYSTPTFGMSFNSNNTEHNSLHGWSNNFETNDKTNLYLTKELLLENLSLIDAKENNITQEFYFILHKYWNTKNINSIIIYEKDNNTQIKRLIPQYNGLRTTIIYDYKKNNETYEMKTINQKHNICYCYDEDILIIDIDNKNRILVS